MAGIFGTRASLLYDINLLLQITILLLLVAGRNFTKDKKLRRHGFLMAAATTLHVISILLIMVPSFIKYSAILVGAPSSLGVIITWLHAIVGTLAAVLAIFIVAAWRLQPSIIACTKRRKLMKPLIIIWLFGLILGIGFYVFYYV